MTTATRSDDQLSALVADARKGDRAALDRLVLGHERWVRSVVFGVLGRVDLVDDVVQQVWTQVWRRIDSLKDVGRLKTWLYAIARNAAIDAGKAHRRRRTVETPGEIDAEDERSRAGPLKLLLRGETHAALMNAIWSLPALYREPLVLRHLEDWSYAEIADALDITVQAVETRLVRARRMLRESLQDRI